MSFLAKLYIHGREINVLHTNVSFYQPVHHATNRPIDDPKGGCFDVVIDKDGTTDLLRPMFSPDAMCNGYIRFYKRDGHSKLCDYEFFDTYVIGHHTSFDGAYGTGCHETIRFSPGILRIGDMVFEKSWKVTDLKAADNVRAVPRKEEKKPKLHTGYFENEQGEKEFRPKKNDTVYYIAKTRDMIGKTIDVDLSDSPILFEHGGDTLKNGVIRELQVTGNRMRIPLKVLQKKK